MGHYDEQYERDAQESCDRTKAEMTKALDLMRDARRELPYESDTIKRHLDDAIAHAIVAIR